MKTKTALAISNFVILLGWFCGNAIAQPSPQEFAPNAWRIPTITSPLDVSIGSSRAIRTDDRYASFLRFTAPGDMDIHIEGIGRLYPDPEACLWELVGGTPQQVAQDDDSGSGRDFLIKHRVEKGKTYVLQVGTRTSSTTTVRITTPQIIVHGDIGSQPLLCQREERVLWGNDFRPSELFGALNEPSWKAGTDFGTSIGMIGQNEREYSIENFALDAESFSIIDLWVSDLVHPFVSRSETTPLTHQKSFKVEKLDDHRFKVVFKPQDAGVIEANLMLEYTLDGHVYQAQIPVMGRGIFFFPSHRGVTLSGTGRSFSQKIEHTLHTFDSGSNKSRAVWMSLDFPRPVRNVSVYIIPKNSFMSPVKATLFESNLAYKRGNQLFDSVNGWSSGSFSIELASKMQLKIELPSNLETGYSQFDVWVFANDY